MTSQPNYFQYLEPPRPCSYLPDQTASLEYRVIHDLTAQVYSDYLIRGWRRHGRYLFRPQCPSCRFCRSIRVPVETFHPSKSQRKALGRNPDVRVTLARATVTDEHVQLYNNYHADMAQRRGWPGTPTTLGDYEASFLASHPEYACELQYHEGDRLIGVGLVDVLPVGISSVYFYHAPDWRPRSPGVYSVLRELELCRRLSVPHLYLGYWIEPCQSMAYKADYSPHELLSDSVEQSEAPVWKSPSI